MTEALESPFPISHQGAVSFRALLSSSRGARRAATQDRSMTEITRVPIKPVAKGSLTKLWIGVALAMLVGGGLAWAAMPRGLASTRRWPAPARWPRWAMSCS
jgi:hypothetical protein